MGETRPALFDTETGTMYYSESVTQRHIAILERKGLPYKDGRYVGGEIKVLEDGSLEFRPISGTFPVGEAEFLPQKVYDKIRGVTTGISIRE